MPPSFVVVQRRVFSERGREEGGRKREKERINPLRATDNDLSPRDRNIPERRLLFRIVLRLLLATTIDDSSN